MFEAVRIIDLDLAWPNRSLGVCRASHKGAFMGDKSPKSLTKHASQKQTKANDVKQKQQQAVAAKQAALKKK